MANRFVSFEGCEGSGKSTQLKLFIDYLQQNNIDAVLAREPGGNQISEKIRDIILDKQNANMSSHAEALLYASARAQLIDEVIMPSLDDGKMVVLDRYIDSSFAYQAYARGLGYEFIQKINDYAITNCMPTVTIFLDIDPNTAFLRKGGADENDRIELEGITFHQKVYNGYKELYKKYPDRIVLIDATLPPKTIHEKIIAILKERNIL